MTVGSIFYLAAMFTLDMGREDLIATEDINEYPGEAVCWAIPFYLMVLNSG